jgi:hypothetical protein
VAAAKVNMSAIEDRENDKVNLSMVESQKEDKETHNKTFNAGGGAYEAKPAKSQNSAALNQQKAKKIL